MERKSFVQFIIEHKQYQRDKEKLQLQLTIVQYDFDNTDYCFNAIQIYCYYQSNQSIL